MNHWRYPLIVMSCFLLASCAGEREAAEAVAAKSAEARQIVLSAKEKNLIQLADASRRSGNIKEAEKLYRQAVAMSTGAVDAHLSLASLLAERDKDVPGALEILQHARKLQPGNVEVLRQLGNGLVDLGRMEEALDVYSDWTARTPDDARAYNARGVALDMLDRHVEAQDVYHKGITLAKDDTGYIENNLALSLMSMGNYDDAISILEKLRGKDGDNETIRQNLALAYGLADKPEKAAELLKGMSKQQIEENQKFYRYIRDQKEKTPTAPPEKKPAKAPEVKKETPPVKPPEKKPEVKKEAPPAPVKEPEKKEVPPAPAKAPEKKPEPAAAPKKEPLLMPEAPEEKPPEKKPEPAKEAPAPVKEETPVKESSPAPALKPAKSVNTLPTKRSVEEKAPPAPEKTEPAKAPEKEAPDNKQAPEDAVPEDEDDESEEKTGDDPPASLPANMDSI